MLEAACDRARDSLGVRASLTHSLTHTHSHSLTLSLTHSLSRAGTRSTEQLRQLVEAGAVESVHPQSHSRCKNVNFWCQNVKFEVLDHDASTDRRIGKPSQVNPGKNLSTCGAKTSNLKSLTMTPVQKPTCKNTFQHILRQIRDLDDAGAIESANPQVIPRTKMSTCGAKTSSWTL